jgi:hypothetical protein
VCVNLPVSHVLTLGQRQASLFLAPEIARFLYLHLFARDRRRYSRREYWATILSDDIPGPLILYACTAMRHALEEWCRNASRRPTHIPDKAKQLRPGEYIFSAGNDARRSALRLPLLALANSLLRGLLAAGLDMEQPSGCISQTGL